MANLPSGYTELEYIESNGTQWVNTGIIPSYNTKVEIDFQLLELPAANVAIFATPGQFSFRYMGQLSTKYFRCVIQTSQVDFYNFSNGLNRMQAVVSGAKCSVENETKTSTASTSFTATNNLILFAYLNNNQYIQNSKCRLFSMAVYNSGVKVRQFVPCKNENSVVGLYDTVGSKFYQNGGTGAFVAGPDVAPPATPSNFYQSTSVVLQWSTVACDGYKLYKNGSLLTTTKLNQYVDSAVANGQDIEYSITAYRGNLESEPQTIQVSVREGYTILTPVITSAFFQ